MALLEAALSDLSVFEAELNRFKKLPSQDLMLELEKRNLMGSTVLHYLAESPQKLGMILDLMKEKLNKDEVEQALSLTTPQGLSVKEVIKQAGRYKLLYNRFYCDPSKKMITAVIQDNDAFNVALADLEGRSIPEVFNELSFKDGQFDTPLHLALCYPDRFKKILELMRKKLSSDDINAILSIRGGNGQNLIERVINHGNWKLFGYLDENVWQYTADSLPQPLSPQMLANLACYAPHAYVIAFALPESNVAPSGVYSDLPEVKVTNALLALHRYAYDNPQATGLRLEDWVGLMKLIFTNTNTEFAPLLQRWRQQHPIAPGIFSDRYNQLRNSLYGLAESMKFDQFKQGIKLFASYLRQRERVLENFWGVDSSPIPAEEYRLFEFYTQRKLFAAIPKDMLETKAPALPEAPPASAPVLPRGGSAGAASGSRQVAQVLYNVNTPAQTEHSSPDPC